MATEAVRLGFTGTHFGMTDAQLWAFMAYVESAALEEFHFGMCEGADFQARGVVGNRCLVVGHPPVDEKRFAPTAVDVLLPARPFLVRDHDIVDASTFLIATPYLFVEQRRGSGTWATIRYAHKRGVRTRIIWPDGSLTCAEAFFS